MSASRTLRGIRMRWQCYCVESLLDRLRSAGFADAYVVGSEIRLTAGSAQLAVRPLGRWYTVGLVGGGAVARVCEDDERVLAEVQTQATSQPP